MTILDKQDPKLYKNYPVNVVTSIFTADTELDKEYPNLLHLEAPNLTSLKNINKKIKSINLYTFNVNLELLKGSSIENITLPNFTGDLIPL